MFLNRLNSGEKVSFLELAHHASRSETFPCTGCGLCCQNIDAIEELKEFNLGNGVCKYFDVTTKSCAIYDDRPDICRVDKMFEIKYSKYFTRKVFYSKNAEVCNQLQTLHGLDKSYEINIGE